MDVDIGHIFQDYKEVQIWINDFQKAKNVNLWKKDSRTIANAKKRGSDKDFKPSIVYSELRYACVHNGTYRPKSTTGARPNSSTIRSGCAFSIRIVASEDGKTLFVKSINSDHNHATSKEEYEANPHVRRMDGLAKEECKMLLKVNGDKKLIKKHLETLTDKKIQMKDIHNIDLELKKELGDSSVAGVISMLNEKYPKYKYDLLKDGNTVNGIFLQDETMRQHFELFPEVLLADSTYKTNDRDLALYALTCVDGHGETQPVCVFLVYTEDEETLTRMVNIFKEDNIKWTSTGTILTDKDMTERLVFKNQMPQVDMQICHFHVLRTFNREITTAKLNIVPSERHVMLEILQKMAYSSSESMYTSHLVDFHEACPNIYVRDYFEKNWGNIKEQWVMCFKHACFTLGENTTNRVESFFGKVKDVITKKNTVKDMLDLLLLTIETQHKEKSYRALQTKIKKPTNVAEGDLQQYQELLTPYAFKWIKYEIGKTNVSQLESTSLSTCSCRFYTSRHLPCQHMMRLAQKENMSIFLPSAVATRWTKEYNDASQTPYPGTPNKVHEFKIKRPSTMSQKFKKADNLLKKAASAMAQMGMDQFERAFQLATEFTNNIVENKVFHVVEVLNHSSSEHAEHVDDVTLLGAYSLVHNVAPSIVDETTVAVVSDIAPSIKDENTVAVVSDIAPSIEDETTVPR